MNLEEARAEIAAVDREMVALFERRMEIAEAIAAWKQERGLPVRDQGQEKRVLENNSALIHDPRKRELYLDFQREVMRLSRRWQRRWMEEASGTEGN